MRISGSFKSVDEMCEKIKLEEGVEGYVLRFDNGQMFKIKRYESRAHARTHTHTHTITRANVERITTIYFLESDLSLLIFSLFFLLFACHLLNNHTC